MDREIPEARIEKRMTILLLALLFVLAPGPARADDAAPGSAPPQPAPTAESLVSTTLGEDIATAGYYELVSWCQDLGLDDSGSRKELQSRLAAHYKVTLPVEAAKGGRIVTVKSARESEYFTVSEVNEKYVILRGDVIVEVRDEAKGSVQEIKARSVTYNQTRHTISAEGDVSYTLTRGKETQQYTGSRFSFDLDSSEGVFYDGSTTRVVSQAGSQLTYTFQGTTISRLENNTVILQDGSFTTSQPVDPFWSIEANTVWILAPNEWAVANALLMVGRIPILYIPAFFWPGDSLFFNPNIGYDNRTGMFIQTTTYLIGRKTKQDNPFSFLQMSDTGETAYKEELRGLFLRKMPGESPPPDKGQNLKLLLDVYSHLGGFLGVTGDFPQLASFRTGVAISRSIFPLSVNGPYSPTWIQPDGTAVSYWNSSSFFGVLVPFRFGMDGNIQGSSDLFSASWKFAYYSDPTFTSDFYNRNEGLNFNAVLQPTTNPVQSAATTSQPTLSWDFVSKLDLSKLVKLPFIQSISFPTINANMTWQSKDEPNSTVDPLASDPGHTFYYPSSITFPNIAFSVSGEILKVGTTPSTAAPSTTAAPGAQAQPGATAAAPAQAPVQSAVPSVPAPAPPQGAAPVPGQAQTAGQPSSQPPVAPQAGAQPAAQAPPAAQAAEKPVLPDPGKGMRMPVFTKPEAPAPSKPAPGQFKEPSRRTDSPGAAGSESTLDVTYQLQPRATLEHTFDTTNWVNKQDVDYSILYRTFDTGGSGQLSAATSLWDRLADNTTTLSLDGEYRYRFDPDANAASTWQSLLQSDLQQDRLTLRGTTQTTVRPLQSIPELSGSTASYRIGVRLYQLSYPDPLNPVLTGVGPTWTPDAISDNTVQSSLVYQTGLLTNTLGLTLQLPPLVPVYTALLQSGTPDVTGRIQAQGAAPISSIPSSQPFVLTAGLDAGPNISVSQALQFDPSASVLQTTTSQMKLWGLTGSFIAQAAAPAPLQPATLNLAYNSGSNPRYYWKDRIKVDASVQTSWNMNLQQPSINELDLTFNLNFSIYQFLDLTFSSVSYNNQTYLYFPGWAAQAGRPWVNPLTDLLQSINFFNIQDRYNSNFKLRSLSVKLVHHLRDWDISLEYSGSPQLRTLASGRQAIEWTPTYSLQIKWLAVPLMQSTMQGDYTGVTVLN